MAENNQSKVDLLLGLAGQGQFILSEMRAWANDGRVTSRQGLTRDMVLAETAAQWVSYGSALILAILGPENATRFMGASRVTTSSTYPQPENLSENLATYWDSIAWRIEQLGEWASDIPS